MKILVVSPHRDDAAFSLTLSIDAWLRAGHTVAVMNCFTRSNYAPFSDAPSVHANDTLSFVSALRQREDESWRKQRRSSGLQFRDLNLKDAPVRLRCPLEELFVREVDASDKAFGAIRKAVKAVAHDALVLPLALGGHLDHRTAQLALREEPDAAPLAFYEDLPYAAWPENLQGIEAYASELARRMGTSLQPAIVERVDVEVAVAAKLRAALCYDSQIESDTAELLAGFSRTYKGAERLWVTPGWSSLTPALTSGEDPGS